MILILRLLGREVSVKTTVSAHGALWWLLPHTYTCTRNNAYLTTLTTMKTPGRRNITRGGDDHHGVRAAAAAHT